MNKGIRRLPIYVHRFKSLPVLLGAVLVLAGSTSVANVLADQYDVQIQNLENQNAQSQTVVNSLQTQATSYQDAIKKLQSQINSIQSQINSNEAKQAELQQQIAELQIQINQEKQVLGDDIKAMYVGGQMTTVEMLATSENLSDFVNAETYDSAVQNKIQSTLTKISQLQNNLKDQQNVVSQLLQTQQSNQVQMSAAQASQNTLLSMNQSQQASYNAKIQANESQIEQLRAEQIAANTSGVTQTLSRGQCGGGYPNYLCNAPQDSIVDPWHMLNRECVSYTAWRASEESPIANVLLQEYNFGNAGNWPASAEQYGAKYGVTVSTTPQAGDIAIRPAIPGVYVAPGDPDVGHAMYVEAVNSNGTITVSEYNEYLDGTYSEEVRATSGVYGGQPYQLQFIHFPN